MFQTSEDRIYLLKPRNILRTVDVNGSLLSKGSIGFKDGVSSCVSRPLGQALIKEQLPTSTSSLLWSLPTCVFGPTVPLD